MGQCIVLRRACAASCLLLAWLTGCGASPDLGAQGGSDIVLAADAQLGELEWNTAVDVAADVPPDVAIPTDVPATPDSVPDVVKVDAGCTTAGCACTDNPQCDSGFCIETDGGRQCAALCTEACAAGFKCGQVSASAGDVINLCLPSYPRLCEPCNADSDCNNVLGGAESRCVPYKDASGSSLGAFCGTSCGDAKGCPSGYGCSEATSLGGVKASQCVKTDLVCLCGARASKLQLTTACSNANDAGTCAGKRGCGVSGLSACDAPNAVPEQCNLKDDDCDSLTDEPSAGMCGDGALCTYDNCVAGACQHPPMTGPCDDGSACSSSDECNNGKCLGTTVVCDDKNPCTLDACDAAKGCLASPDDSAACEDGSACTVGDACKGGGCVAGAFKSCDDGNACTTDSCEAKKGCVVAASNATCNDGNLCTDGDQCKDGACLPGPGKVCEDGNACTTDLCDAGKGCIQFSNAEPCTDSNVCTEGDQCQGGKCTPGKAKSCNDNKPCTDDACDALKGCTVQNNSAACSDGDACTSNDGCAGGVCVGGNAPACNDGNPCTDDGCDKVKGCQSLANSAGCSDSNVCTESDACKDGKCWPGLAKLCNDGNPCTDDSCDPVKGCVSTNNTASCTDNDACTLLDGCSNGSCAGGGAVDCDDGNGCTADNCLKSKGCTHLANTSACSDGNVCSQDDACQNGSCFPGGAKDCDDGNACTTDSCYPTKGCVNLANTAPCEDGSVCTESDACKDGKCAPGQIKVCSDSNACTDDGCDKVTGCTFVANSASCDDGSACTANDVCTGKLCGGKAITCDDGNPCTTDTCVASTGCKYVSLSDQADCGSGKWCMSAKCVLKPFCGDGVINQVAEKCDDGNQTPGDGCEPDCTLALGKKCSNGSATDCNPAGQTLISSSAFVDQNPPAGWTQCAGFVNTSGDDVGNTALDNCLNTKRLRLKAWDANGTLEEDVYSEGLNQWSAWPNWNYLGGSMTKVKSTYWTGGTTFFTALGNDACATSGCGAAPCGTLTLGTGNSSSALVTPGNSNALEWRISCGGAALAGRKVALYK